MQPRMLHSASLSNSIGKQMAGRLTSLISFYAISQPKTSAVIHLEPRTCSTAAGLSQRLIRIADESIDGPFLRFDYLSIASVIPRLVHGCFIQSSDCTADAPLDIWVVLSQCRCGFQ